MEKRLKKERTDAALIAANSKMDRLITAISEGEEVLEVHEVLEMLEVLEELEALEERRCSRVREGLERTTGLRKELCKGSTSTPEWLPHPSSGSRADTETNHVCTSWTCKEPGFLNKRMNDHVTIYESVESVCMNDGSESGSNINLLELSRIKEGPGEEAQGKERSSSESRMMDTARFNKLTEKQANPNIIMIDYNEQVRANSTKSVKKPRIEELGEDEHDGAELNPWAATKSTGKDDNISTKYFHQSMKTKVIGDRDESVVRLRKSKSCQKHLQLFL